ncbi:MAG: hypothetical protein GDA56_05000 [Hormoscilla sp. GM7CHS1pb]|nr:hypothetical protein [Hormoscilla sp. GM7CHS1pb]
MDRQSIRDKIRAIASKRLALVRLLEKPDLGTMRIDVNQALEEIDDLIDDINRTFPSQAS